MTILNMAEVSTDTMASINDTKVEQIKKPVKKKGVKPIWKCPICLDERAYPMMTNCGHSICHDCYQRIDKCPLCKKKVLFVKNNYDLADLCGVKPIEGKDLYHDINELLCVRNMMYQDYIYKLSEIILQEIIVHINEFNLGENLDQTDLKFEIKPEMVMDRDVFDNFIDYFSRTYQSKFNNKLEIKFKWDNGADMIEVNLVFKKTNDPIDEKDNTVINELISVIDNLIDDHNDIILSEIVGITRDIFDTFLEKLVTLVTLSIKFIDEFNITMDVNDSFTSLHSKILQSYLNKILENIKFFNFSHYDFDDKERKFIFHVVMIPEHNIKISDKQLQKIQFKKLNDLLDQKNGCMNEYLSNIYQLVLDRFIVALTESNYDNMIAYGIELEYKLNNTMFEILEKKIKDELVTKLKQQTNFMMSMDNNMLSIIFELLGQPTVFPMRNSPTENNNTVEEHSGEEESSDNDSD